jgi:hypothetical protein
VTSRELARLKPLRAIGIGKASVTQHLIPRPQGVPLFYETAPYKALVH